MSKVEEEINKVKKLSSEIDYLEDEFNGRLYGSCPDGDVKLFQMIAFAKEYGWLLEHIIKVAEELDIKG